MTHEKRAEELPKGVQKIIDNVWSYLMTGFKGVGVEVRYTPTIEQVIFTRQELESFTAAILAGHKEGAAERGEADFSKVVEQVKLTVVLHSDEMTKMIEDGQDPFKQPELLARRVAARLYPTPEKGEGG